MCDPVTLGLGLALSAGGALVNKNDAANNANAQAAASNAALAQTIAKENGFEATNQAAFKGNIANYAPGAQDKQLADAQAGRAANSTGNITQTDPSSVPLPAGSNPAAAGDLAKRMLAVHDGAVSRAGLNAKVGGYGDTWLTNSLNTAATDRGISVTNNLADGQKAITPALEQDASAAAYQAPSIWGPLLTGAGSIAAGKAGTGGLSMPKVNASGVWNPIAGVTGQ